MKLRATGSETNVDMTSHLMHSDEVRCPTEQSAAEANGVTTGWQGIFQEQKENKERQLDFFCF